MDKSIDVVDLKTLRKKYIGAKLNNEKVDEEYSAFMNLDAGTFEMEFYYTQDWAGDELTYELLGDIDSEGRIVRIAAPHCLRLRGDDARGSGYSGKRLDDFDYWQIDKNLEKLVLENEG